MKLLSSILLISAYYCQQHQSMLPSFVMQIMSAPPGTEAMIQKCSNNLEIGYCPKSDFQCC